jgi:hypothetical protein
MKILPIISEENLERKKVNAGKQQLQKSFKGVRFMGATIK